MSEPPWLVDPYGCSMGLGKHCRCWHDAMRPCCRCEYDDDVEQDCTEARSSDYLTPPYSTIVADPPWAYPGNALTGKRRIDANASAQYSTLTSAEVARLPVGELADENAHAYLWCTATRLFDSPTPAEVLEGWGFRFIALLTWVKQGPLGLGQYFRIDTEHVAFGVRGRLPIEPAHRIQSWFTAQKGHHSAKPPAFLDLVEQVSPAPRVELFARAPRLGWDSWGKGYELPEMASTSPGEER